MGTEFWVGWHNWVTTAPGLLPHGGVGMLLKAVPVRGNKVFTPVRPTHSQFEELPLTTSQPYPAGPSARRLCLYTLCTRVSLYCT